MSVSPTHRGQSQQQQPPPADRHHDQRDQPRQQPDITSDIRDMISTLTNRLSPLHHLHKQPGSSSTGGPHHRNHPDHDDEKGFGIITLAGNNTGAIMRTVFPDEKASDGHPRRHHWMGVGRPVGKGDGSTAEHDGNEHENDHHGDNDDENDLGGDWGSSAHVNSNVQAINNSIMLGGSYSSKNPGVHMEISDVADAPKGSGHGGDRPHRNHLGKKVKQPVNSTASTEREEAHDHSHHSE